MRLIAGLATLLSVLCFATGASAHATLVSTEPGDGSVLALAPKSVQLRFNEAVTPAVVRVIDAAGTTRDAVTVRVDGDTIVVALPDNLPRGIQFESGAIIERGPAELSTLTIVGRERPSAATARQYHNRVVDDQGRGRDAPREVLRSGIVENVRAPAQPARTGIERA